MVPPYISVFTTLWLKLILLVMNWIETFDVGSFAYFGLITIKWNISFCLLVSQLACLHTNKLSSAQIGDMGAEFCLVLVSLVQFGLAWFGLVQLNSVGRGWVRVWWVRLHFIDSGEARLMYVWFCSIVWFVFFLHWTLKIVSPNLKDLVER